MLLSTALNIIMTILMKYITLWDLIDKECFIQYGTVFIIFDLKNQQVLLPRQKHDKEAQRTYFLKGSLLQFTHECDVLPVP